MGTHVRVNLDQGRFRAYLHERAGVVGKRGAESARRKVQSNIVASGRVNTGAMLNSIKTRQVSGVHWEVYTNSPYAGFQEEGIGPVYPKSAKVLRFKPKGSGVFVFAHRTSGFSGAHFMRDAYRSMSLRDFL